jgi:hypothetical protein
MMVCLQNSALQVPTPSHINKNRIQSKETSNLLRNLYLRVPNNH